MNLGRGDRRRGDEPRKRRSEARRRTSVPEIGGVGRESHVSFCNLLGKSFVLCEDLSKRPKSVPAINELLESALLKRLCSSYRLCILSGVDCNLVSWASIISSAAENRRQRDALKLFCKMLESGLVPEVLAERWVCPKPVLTWRNKHWKLAWSTGLFLVLPDL
ncbi:hypothetical protein FCM35_KLT02532 [Carex littledalei]|uniref:Pentatricopeptide repeat-containing protein n=1 Tax=Carex littledalei TaxID=544730 RepID=A0A833VMJ4_9POAL|nr:hypothetical protein FCM35_KLT02532 [Carex littledalei]